LKREKKVDIHDTVLILEKKRREKVDIQSLG
jgi:hypothetical protein